MNPVLQMHKVAVTVDSLWLDWFKKGFVFLSQQQWHCSHSPAQKHFHLLLCETFWHFILAKGTRERIWADSWKQCSNSGQRVLRMLLVFHITIAPQSKAEK